MANLIIPEIILVNTVNLAIVALRKDYETVTVNQGRNETESMLYDLLGDTYLDRYHLFTEAKKLILTTPEKDGLNHIEVKLSFDANSWKGQPVVYVTMPSSNARNNSLGLGEGNNKELLDVLNGNTSFIRQFERRDSANYNIVVMSNNSMSTVLLYHIIRLLLLTCNEHLEASGLSNIQFSGGDVMLRDQIPDKIFSKYIGLSFEYNMVSREFNINPVIDKINVIIKLKQG